MLNMAIDENNALFRAISRFCFKSDEDFSDTKLYTLINASPMMAYILDIDGNFILGNNRAKEFFTTGADIMPSGRYIKFDINSVKTDITKENKQVIALGKVIDIEKQLPTRKRREILVPVS